MTEKQILQWIKDNLREPILSAVVGNIYTEDWLAAMACREVGGLINKYVTAGVKPPDIWEDMRGDYTQRKGETAKQYHGYSPWQIDTASFPLWINAGLWKDPYKAALMAVSVLEGKRKYISSHTQLQGEALNRAITAAYNAGEGNIVKALAAGDGVDSRTANHNYSADVWRLREIYKTL